MTKGMKKLLLSVLVVFFGIFILFGAGTKAQAVSKIKTLTKNKTYSTKLTGKTTYKLCYKESKNSKYSECKDCKIYVNGKLKKTISTNSRYSYNYTVKLLTVSSNRKLIYVQDHEDNDYVDFNYIYEYKNGKMVLLKDLCSLTRSSGTKADKLLTGWGRGELYSFDGKTLCMRWDDCTAATGNIYYIASYTIKGTSITKNSTTNAIRSVRTGKANPKWTAKCTFKAYTAIGGSKLAFTVKPNDIVTMKLMTVKNGKRYFQVTNSKGKTGWVLNPSYVEGEGYFKECLFAG